ncbi:hypothetical protein CUJ83_12935 [Methanocella sp. CWC-04]|uniref:Transglutaminase-like domain-containing protein n=1 Tax=Methanooceanicella nereidis TaxID=2052831 RepID=A0AAP2W8B8_9EURY|nr:transglutaminase domain-containing protein [Methanocella sp. CWC-04]MCD1295901.1 hypothetical protein [Methanocella sp. CWC-04]
MFKKIINSILILWFSITILFILVNIFSIKLDFVIQYIILSYFIFILPLMFVESFRTINSTNNGKLITTMENILIKIKKAFKINNNQKVLLLMFIVISSVISFSTMYNTEHIDNIIGKYYNNKYTLELSNNIINQSDTDKNNTIKILDWQKQNLLNIYGKSFSILYTNSYLIINYQTLLKESPKEPYLDYILRIPYNIKIDNFIFFSNENPKNALFSIYTRYQGTSNSSLWDSGKWAIITKSGACGEYSFVFTELANMSNIKVRNICLNGEDHAFNEVLIDDEWITIDSTQENAYDPELDMESYLKLDISYAYALYPNGTIEDVTYRYTNLSNINIYVYDGNENTVNNSTIKIYSNNKRPNLFTNLSLETGQSNCINYNIGSGNYNIEVFNESYSGKLLDVTIFENKVNNIYINITDKIDERQKFNKNDEQNYNLILFINSLAIIALSALLVYLLLIIDNLLNNIYNEVTSIFIIGISFVLLLIMIMAIDTLFYFSISCVYILISAYVLYDIIK